MSNLSTAVTRSTNDRAMEICHSCISYLNDRFVFEKGLFRSPASLTDVRLLQTQMMYQGSASIIPDHHLSTFKKLNSCRKQMSDSFLTINFLYKHNALFDSGGSNRVRNESDPHIVTGVLQKTLKELSPSPLYEVYEDILSTEISEDSAHSRQIVQNWLVKLPQDRFELVRKYSINVLQNFPLM